MYGENYKVVINKFKTESPSTSLSGSQLKMEMKGLPTFKEKILGNSLRRQNSQVMD
ncbi:hypothetical protein K0M31_007146 [Melipona bicolor]|uniref:Uncharacterized protein n=1 Tax=Melipona bicolor TaxID=60889 RepID=A0AA40KKT6_9HYME|nr:hypothetical protein K0M31_007146 [Melipona bicolor]